MTSHDDTKENSDQIMQNQFMEDDIVEKKLEKMNTKCNRSYRIGDSK